MKVGQVFIRVSIPRKKDEEEKWDENVISPKLFHMDEEREKYAEMNLMGWIFERETFPCTI